MSARDGCSMGRPGWRGRLLLAEDDLEMRRLLATRLRRLGFEVVEVADGWQLLELAMAGATDGSPSVGLVISDVRMPGLTGLEVLARLRRSAYPAPVILVTAFGDRATHAEATRLGAAAVLDKPFELDELCRAALAAMGP